MFRELLDEIKNISVTKLSVRQLLDGFSFSTALALIMSVFMLIGAWDALRGNKRGYGERFNAGFNALGPLALSMIGITVATPVLRLMLQPLIKPLFALCGASDAMLAGLLLPVDAGGYALAAEMAAGNTAAARFSGIILAGTFGCMLTGVTPIVLIMIDRRDRGYYAAAMLIALIVIPFGCLIGGLVMSACVEKVSFMMLIKNLCPMFILAAIVALMLIKWPKPLLKALDAFGTGLQLFIIACLALASFQYLTGIRLPLVHLMVDSGEGVYEDTFVIIGGIAVMLAGAFPLMLFLTRKLNKPLNKLGNKLGMDAVGCAGCIACLANVLAQLGLFDKMNPKSKLMNLTLAATCSFVLGDHMAFTASADPEMLLPLTVAKLVCGALSVLLVQLLANKLLPMAKLTAGKEE